MTYLNDPIKFDVEKNMYCSNIFTEKKKLKWTVYENTFNGCDHGVKTLIKIMSCLRPDTLTIIPGNILRDNIPPIDMGLDPMDFPENGM